MSDPVGKYFVGLNCGLSADGIDTALIDCTDPESLDYKVVAHESMLMPDSLRREILAVAGGKQVPSSHLAGLQKQLASAACAMCNNVIAASGVDRMEIDAIGWSGYPLCNDDGAVIELDGGEIISQKTGIITVSKFYSSMAAAGGKPMGLSAGFDWKRFNDEKLCRVLVHLGALAEVTFIPAGSQPEDMLTGIVGPGTGVIDEISFRYKQRIYDTDGAMAAAGKINHMLLSELQSDKFYREELPKFASMEKYSPVFLLRLMNMAEKHDCGREDLIATLTELSAWCVSEAILSLTQRPHEVILCGGGAKNIHLAGRIRQMLSPTSTYTSEKFDIGLTCKKAVDFALLAVANINGVITMIPQASQARESALLGSMAGGLGI